MSTRKSNVKIENNKVIFSQEIINYFESLRNEETSEWIDKYFEVLSDIRNIDSEKYHFHHIKPCFTFKDEEHKNRKQTRPLADKFNENIIKLSIYNHFFAHFYLWKIFNNVDSKWAFQHMCGQNTYIDNLTENELKEIVELKEECAKKNQTEEDSIQYQANYRKTHKKSMTEYNHQYRSINKESISKQRKKKYNDNREEELEKKRNYYKNNKEEISQKHKKRYENNKEKILKQSLEYRNKNREKINKKKKEWCNQQCYDPIKKDYCTLNALRARKYYNKELYKCIIPSKYIIK